MIKTQRLGATLTSLDTALALLLEGVEPLARSENQIGDSATHVACDIESSNRPLPPFNAAAVDGWALRARDLVGASSYSPVALTASPLWVEVGDRMPEGCDCVLDADLVDITGPLAQAIAEAIPGQGVYRAGELMVGGSNALSRIAARGAIGDAALFRSPRLRILDVASRSGLALTAGLVADLARGAGATVTLGTTKARDAASIGEAIGAEKADMLILIGGTGVGRTDASADTLAAHGALLMHGVAIQPGRTTAIGKLQGMPVIAMPGMPDQICAAWLMLAKPLLDRLSARQPQRPIMLPLARKISSAIGVAEIALLKRADDSWMPLAVGAVSLDHLAEADAWFAVPAGSEGYAPGERVGAAPFTRLDDE